MFAQLFIAVKQLFAKSAAVRVGLAALLVLALVLQEIYPAGWLLAVALSRVSYVLQPTLILLFHVCEVFVLAVLGMVAVEAALKLWRGGVEDQHRLPHGIMSWIVNRIDRSHILPGLVAVASLSAAVVLPPHLESLIAAIGRALPKLLPTAVESPYAVYIIALYAVVFHMTSWPGAVGPFSTIYASWIPLWQRRALRCVMTGLQWATSASAFGCVGYVVVELAGEPEWAATLTIWRAVAVVYSVARAGIITLVLLCTLFVWALELGRLKLQYVRKAYSILHTTCLMQYTAPVVSLFLLPLPPVLTWWRGDSCYG